MTPERSDPLSLEEVRVGAAYDAERAEERRRVAELKRFRRVHLGESLALVFENRDTIRSTLEEALRTERVEDPERVAGEIAAFNAVVPTPGDLAATLFLEVDDPADLNAAVVRLDGVEDTVFIEVAGSRVRGVPEEVFPPGESRARPLPAVQPRAGSAGRHPERRAGDGGHGSPGLRDDRRAGRGPPSGDRQGPLIRGRPQRRRSAPAAATVR